MYQMSDGSEFHCFGPQVEKQRWTKVFALKWGIMYQTAAVLLLQQKEHA